MNAKAIKHLHKAREAKHPAKFLTKKEQEEIIQRLRATRQQLWQEKYAGSSRH